MRLATFEYQGKEGWGFVINNPYENRLWVYEPYKVDKHLRASAVMTNGYAVSMPVFMPDCVWPDTLQGFLALEDEGMEVLRRLETFLIRYLEQSDEARMAFCGHPVDDVQLKSPIPQPRLMWGLVQNSPTFIRSNAQRQSTNLFPMGHQRPVGSVVGHGQPIVHPANIGNPAFNVELGIVIGKKGRYIPVNRAMEYVAGYTVVTDTLIHGYHKLIDTEGEGHYNLADKLDWYVGATISWGGKMSDTHCAVGPWITTREEIGNVYDLLVYTKMGGRLRDRAHTCGTLIGVERVIQWYSSFATLYPGDIIHLGTLGTDGLKIAEDMIYSGQNCTMDSEIEKIGTVSNPIVNLTYPDWREDDEPSKAIHASPAARDVILSGKDTIESVDDWNIEDARHLWAVFKNYDSVTEREGIQKLKTPRFLANPASALGVTGSVVELPPKATDLEISVELGAVVKKLATGVSAENFDDYILGYTPMISITDHSFKEILVGPTTNQEKYLPEVYGRWADGFNTILPKPVDARWKDVVGKKMKLCVEGIGEAEANTGEYYCNIGDIGQFISVYVTMFPGDVITLGHTGDRIIIPRDKVRDGMKITASIEGMGELEITLKKSDAPNTFVPFNQLKL